MKKNIERSREIRQWLNLLTRWFTFGAIVDCTINDGNTIKSIGNWIKSKWSSLKTQFKK